jgi:anaerobic selenocysteine-containing dehydrogenase
MPTPTEFTLTRRTMLAAAGAAGVGSALPGVAQAAAAGDKLIPTFCAMCGPSAGCGIQAVVRDGKFVGIESWPEAPLNHGKNCPKAHAAPQWVYSEQRLKHPMKRIGAKGEGKFQRISWDEALDTVAAKLKEQKAKYGPESLAILSPAHRSYSNYLYRFLTAHGSPNYGHSGICAMQKGFTFSYTLGAAPRPDIDHTKLVLIWAKQPVYAGSSKGSVKQLLDAKARGAKVVAIKPTMEPDVALADIWVPIRPGTDAALALGMLHVIIGEKLYDAKFVEEWTFGFDKLAEHVRKHTPEWAERITGVAAKQIREVARLYATTKPACIDHGNGFEHAPSCNSAIRAVGILMAITGNLDRQGGDIFGGGPGGGAAPAGAAGGGRGAAGQAAGTASETPAGRGATGRGGRRSLGLSERYTQEWVDKLVGPEFPKAFQPGGEGTSSAYYRIWESVLTGQPYPVRSIIAPGTQASVSTRGTRNVLDAMKKLDFYVVVDVTETADMAFADIVIPVATMYETDHPFETGEGWILARNKVIEPLGDYKSDYEFWIDLGVRMGYGKDFWNGSITECMNEQLSPYGVTLEELRAKPLGIALPARKPTYGKYAQVFASASTRLSRAPYLPEGKVAIYNTTFEANGFSPLPEWVEPPESPTATPELLAKYPLVFSDFHTSKVYNAGWLRNVPYLREVMPDPTLHIHTDTAKARGIAQGDWVIVESPHGSMKVKAEVNPGIRPDTVMALHGWWQGCKELGKPFYPLLRGGANANSMYSTDPKKAYDPVVTAMTSQTLVQVRKA